MVESKYSLLTCVEYFNKFVPLFKNLTNMPKLFINIESKLTLKNISSIINAINLEKLPISSFVIGRTDLAASLGINDIENDEMLKITKDLLQMKSGFDFTLGGNLKANSFPFIEALSKEGLVAFESRKCTFKYSNIVNNQKFIALINSGLEFELAWLNCKKSLYSNRSEEENMRINKIISRLENS